MGSSNLFQHMPVVAGPGKNRPKFLHSSHIFGVDSRD
jgi:hypothetical protein